MAEYICTQAFHFPAWVQTRRAYLGGGDGRGGWCWWCAVVVLSGGVGGGR
jgi:hypothetical protein